MEANIAEALRPFAVPIDSLTEYPGNPRRGNVPAIMSSLARFGQQRPVVVQHSTGHIVAGNHIAKAASALGWTHIAAVRVEMDDEEATRALLADNRLSDLAVYDPVALRRLLGELDATDSLEGTGFTRAELNAMMLAAGSGSSPGHARTGFVEESGWPGPVVRQVVLTFRNDDEAEEFLRLAGDLRAAYGTSDLAATILRALERQVAEARS